MKVFELKFKILLMSLFLLLYAGYHTFSNKLCSKINFY